MRYFRVTVHPMRVQIDEQVKELKAYDCRALVDGDNWLYKIIKSSNIPKTWRGWRERAYHHIHYHANNSGSVVRFEHVHHQKRRKRKISPKQLSFPM